MEIEMETKNGEQNQVEIKKEEVKEGHTDLETCWWSSDCDIKIKNRKLKVLG